jgi:microcystin-dependent protein
MSQPYLGQIILVGFNFAPVGFLPCDGRLLAIAENPALFNLIGTTYGGDGQTTFGLPDLQGRVPMNQGQGPGLSPRTIGELGGVENVTLLTTQVPQHTHVVNTALVTAAISCKTGAGNTASPVGNVPAGEAAGVTMTYSSQAADSQMGGTLNAGATASSGQTGGNFPHDNMQPFVAMQYCIALQGIFPSQT